MNKVTFPALNLNLYINRIAFKIGNMPIYWYAVFIVFSICLVLFLCKKKEGKYNIYFQTIIELSIFVLPISILCARLYYVLFNLNYYVKNPMQICNLQDGGLAIYGAILGGIATIYFYSKRKKICFIDILDYIAVYLPLAQAIGRLGNFFNIEAYGTETTSFFRMGIIKNGNYIEVHPTFLYEIVANIIIYVFLSQLEKRRKYKGQITCWYFLLYGIARTIIESLRIDSLMIDNIKVSKMLSIFIVIGCILFLMQKRLATKSNVK